MRAIRYLALVLLVAAPVARLRGQTVTAFKSGEQTTGTTKQCYYKFGSNAYTQTVSAVTLCPLTLAVALSPPTRTNTPAAPAATPRVTPTVTAFKSGEQTTGMTKQCYYSFGANSYTKTLSSVDLCPLSLQVRLP